MSAGGAAGLTSDATAGAERYRLPLALQVAPSGERSTQGDLVGILEVAPHG